MSWLARLFGRKSRMHPLERGYHDAVEREDRARRDALAEERARHERQTQNEFNLQTLEIAGVDPLGGEREQMRVTYAGTWDGPVFVTVTLDPDRGSGSASIVHPGEDYRVAVQELISGEAPRAATTRREERARTSGPRLDALRDLLEAGTFWELTSGEIRGTDGYWITVEVWSPERGGHSASDWCPSGQSALGVAAAAVLEAAIAAEPELGLAPWARRLLHRQP